MAPPQQSASPSASTTLLPFLGDRSRRGSLASITSRAAVDKGILAQALDEIHKEEAAKSEALTSFHDFDGEGGRNAAKELVSNSVSGLFNRFKQSVGSTNSVHTRDSQTRPKSSESKESLGARSLQSVSPTASRSSHTLSLKKSSAEPSPVPNQNVPVSPVVKNGSNTANNVEARSSTPRLHTVDGKPIPLFDSEEKGEKAKEETRAIVKAAKPSQDAPTKKELDQAQRAWVDGDTSDAATDALAKVLSNYEVSISDQPKSSRDLRVQVEDLENAVDDSDYAEGEAPGVKASTAPSRPPELSLTLPDPRPVASTSLRPPMVKVGASHLPGFEPSGASSTTDGADVASFSSSQPTIRRAALEPSPNINSALQRRRTGNLKPPPNSAQNPSWSTHLKRRVLSKDLWMKDDNAKVCFSCGQSFSTFRRKHHCRTCGQIFDAKCTNLVNGRPFGQPGTVRLCKGCESMILNSEDDDSTLPSDDDDYTRSPLVQTYSQDEDSIGLQVDGPVFSRTDAEVMTPSIGIPVSRRNREAKRRSAIIEFDTQPTLARPSSSHSLISLSRRPRSSSHRRRHSRHHPHRGMRASLDERGPFHQDTTGDVEQKTTLPTFHNDNIIDPDLAAFLSDEGSDEDDHPNIMSAVGDAAAASPGDREKLGFGSLFTSAFRKGRSKTGEKLATASSGRGLKEEDTKAQSKLSRSRNLSNGSMSYNRPSPRRSRSNLLSAPLDVEAPDQKPFTRNQSHAKVIYSSVLHSRHNTAERDDVELYPASYSHVEKLLGQLLRDSSVAAAAAWQKALLPIILQCTDDVEPDVQRGDDMDIRHYIKLKKVPGGRPGDTSYVSGIVFSKNIALKTMQRSITDPRIVIVTFAIEYARQEAHFMSLEPVIAQEQEYLENLVSRIAALRPGVLLVQKHVSGLALRLLEKAGITVAYNIKASVLAAVARVTQTRMITSIDKLGIDPSELGQCDSFEVKTYLAEGMRKTYIYLSGCEPDLGCTIVLRGADTKTLRCIKRITEFMCYVAYSLKLENYLMRDEFVSIPHNVQNQMEAHDDPFSWRSPTVPSLEEAQRSIIETLGQESGQGELHFKYEGVEMETRERILSASPFVVFMQPYILTQLRNLECRLAQYKLLRDVYAEADEEGEDEENEAAPVNENFKLVEPEMVNAPPSKEQPKAVREYLHAVHEAQYVNAKHTYETQERQWDSFVNGEVDPFDPFSHQKIYVLHSTVSSITSAPCIGPDLLAIDFYAGYSRAEADQDLPFGQFIEDMCLTANDTCKDCNKHMYDHHRQYVHGYGQLSVSIQRQPAKMRGYANTILMWSTCRVCRQETTVIPMSDHTWKYSFAKYLELSFWSSPLHPRAGLCKHDIHKDFLRCFGFQEWVVRLQYDHIDIYDVVVPRGRVNWKVEADLTVKNEQYTAFQQRLESFTNSVKKRLDSINVDTLEEKKAYEAQAVLERLRQKIDDDHHELLAKLQRKYATSRYFELIPLNRALRFMDEKAIEWDVDFSNFERDYFPSETDIRKLAALQLRNMFVESQPSTAVSVTGDLSDTEGGTELTSIRTPEATRHNSPEEIMSEKAHDVLSSTVQENKVVGDDDGTLRVVKSNETERTLGGDITRVTTPRQDHEEAVEREDVKHLDLAVPTQSPTTADEGPSFTEDPPEPLHEVDDSRDEPFATQPKPLSSGLLERIEQIRNNRAAGGEQDVSESKIPRLADLKIRDASPRPVPPPLLRAQSQPGHVQRRSADLSSEISIDAVASGQPSVSNSDVQVPDKRLATRLGVGRLASKVGKVAPSLIPRSIPQNKNEDQQSSSVSALAKHFEQMSREFEKERLKERRQRAMRSRQARANPLASSRPIVEVYQNATDAVGEKSQEKVQHDAKTHNDKVERGDFVSNFPPGSAPAVEQETKSVRSIPEDGAVNNASVDTDTEDDTLELDTTLTRSRDISDPTSGMSSSITSPTTAPDLSDLGPDLSFSEQRKGVWFKYLAEFWSKRSASGWASLEYPLHANEHVFEDSDIIVREDEPSSVIALSLACADYQNKVKQFRSHPSKAPLAKHGHMHSHLQTNMGGPMDESRESVEASLLSDTATHMKYSFNHGPVNATCKIFYAESFDALRRKCGVSERFIESMSRCLKFDSKGGKTKSLFLRTLDGRFIIKSLQKVELEAFTRFAPDYFNFMSYTLFHGVPSVIAKMFGLFQVTITNSKEAFKFDYYLLVMENLFYERTPNRRFDLKGSMRNRKIESTGQADEVLLDENLVDTIFETPLFVREHSRKLLQASVFNDTLWLCKQNVMDYSLMAGFDDAKKDMIVGIIDCIRTYTWDKKLESWIKDRGKNKPTITSPKDYRNRFRASMRQYVLQAPNCWHQFQAQMAPPKTLKEGQETTRADTVIPGQEDSVIDGGDDGSVAAEGSTAV